MGDVTLVESTVETCACCTCGYEWIKGQSGSHGCTTLLLKQIEELKATAPVLFLECDKPLSEDATTHLRQTMSRLLGGRKVVLLCDGLKLANQQACTQRVSEPSCRTVGTLPTGEA